MMQLNELMEAASRMQDRIVQELPASMPKPGNGSGSRTRKPKASQTRER